MKIHFGPRTKWGEQSVALLLIACFFLVVARIVIAIQHPVPNQPLFSNLALDVPMLGAVATAILGGIAGGAAIIRDKERSTSVFAATLVGIFILFLVADQFVGGI